MPEQRTPLWTPGLRNPSRLAVWTAGHQPTPLPATKLNRGRNVHTTCLEGVSPSAPLKQRRPVPREPARGKGTVRWLPVHPPAPREVRELPVQEGCGVDGTPLPGRRGSRGVCSVGGSGFPGTALRFRTGSDASVAWTSFRAARRGPCTVPLGTLGRARPCREPCLPASEASGQQAPPTPLRASYEANIYFCFVQTPLGEALKITQCSEAG